MPGGDVSESAMLAALAEIYEAGGDDMAPNARLARQFELLAHAAEARMDEDASEPSDNEDSQILV